ncbi:cytochrome b [Marinobacter salinexigens]|uniref:Cytochrome b n=1 Tax=Marinobacter salinexigens TaxID=2919747 RepID=A0A5B0VJI4_9GAMM|nr:cytochrome b/b6 domain-containing protein [Marinobacter salinexigens]KAA1174443.1 cytochrome b [Marinobacter salinexigens]
MSLKDNSQRYGSISRLLHWGMALLLLWQFLSAIFRVVAEDTAIEQFFWSVHKPLGFLLLILAAIRLIWALANSARRPASLNKLATLGHLGLYALLIVVPALALLRQYGSGRAFDPFGIPLFAGFEEKIGWMIEPGNLLHGWLGWLLLAMIVGHIVMVKVHRRSPSHEDVLPRMLGN